MERASKTNVKAKVGAVGIDLKSINFGGTELGAMVDDDAALGEWSMESALVGMEFRRSYKRLLGRGRGLNHEEYSRRFACGDEEK